MKLKLSEIVNNEKGIEALAAVELPIKISYNIKRLIRKIRPELDTYIEARNSLITELGEEDPKTKNITVKPENSQEYARRLGELLDVEVEIDFEPIKISDLGDIKVSSNALVEWMFEE